MQLTPLSEHSSLRKKAQQVKVKVFQPISVTEYPSVSGCTEQSHQRNPASDPRRAEAGHCSAQPRGETIKSQDIQFKWMQMVMMIHIDIKLKTTTDQYLSFVLSFSHWNIVIFRLLKKGHI